MSPDQSENKYNYPNNYDRWIEIDLDAIGKNLKTVRAICEDCCKILAVVKADAYGLGAVEVARYFEDKVEMLAVTTVEEGMELRQNGIQMPILVFTPVNESNAKDYRKYLLTATIEDKEGIEVMANSGDEPHPCHLKVNLGMNRLGCHVTEAEFLLTEMNKYSSLEIAGFYSHLAKAKNKSQTETKKQIKTFLDLVKSIDEKGIKRGLAHLANSTAFLRYPESRLDMARLGTLLYGQSSFPLPEPYELATPFRAFARVIAVREIDKGDTVGYGGDYIAPRKQKIAIISIGFGDGFSVEPYVRDDGFIGVIRQAVQKTARILVRRPLHYVIWKGKKLQLVGRVGMQLCAVDIRENPVNKGDVVEVRIFRFSADSRIRRYYFEDGLLKMVRSILENKQQEQAVNRRN